jgi:hypothetical protein
MAFHLSDRGGGDASIPSVSTNKQHRAFVPRIDRNVLLYLSARINKKYILAVSYDPRQFSMYQVKNIILCNLRRKGHVIVVIE